MRHRPPPPEHAEAVSRRLATLSAELAAVRGDPPTAHRHTQVRSWGTPDPAGDGPDDPLPDAVRWDEHGAAGTLPATAPRVPVPGRHASRRLVDRLRLSTAHLAVLAVVAAVAVGVSAWLVVRSVAEPVPLADPVPVPEPLVGTATGGTAPGPAQAPAGGAAAGSPPSGAAESGAAESGAAESGAAAAAGEVTVDVAGKVRRPGIAVLPPGARVVDALEAAGGARPGIDLTGLNLARQLVDGEQILVGVAPPGGSAAAAVGVPGAPAPGPLVNLNTADGPTLETLPGVGPVTAAAILAWRAAHGGFTAVDELLEVDGIGDATLAEIAPHVTI